MPGWSPHLWKSRGTILTLKVNTADFAVRVSEDPIRSHMDDINILVSFDAETVFRHADKVTKGGAIIYDSDLSTTALHEVPTIDEHAAERITEMLENGGNSITVNGMLEFAKRKGAVLYDIPYFGLLKQFSQEINEPALSSSHV